jgi:hypothetical protein
VNACDSRACRKIHLTIDAGLWYVRISLLRMSCDLGHLDREQRAFTQRFQVSSAPGLSATAAALAT